MQHIGQSCLTDWPLLLSSTRMSQSQHSTVVQHPIRMSQPNYGSTKLQSLYPSVMGTIKGHLCIVTLSICKVGPSPGQFLLTL